MANKYNFTPDVSKFKFGYTSYGFPDKSYDVKNNTFTDYQTISADGKLLNASIVIDTKSVDTFADKRNWARDGEWTDSVINMRNQNIANGLFAHFSDDGKINTSIKEIQQKNIILSLKMNGVERLVTMVYQVKKGVLEAKGRIDLLDFNTKKALQYFAIVCTNVWHRGKTWTDIDIYFSVPVKEKDS